MKNNSNADEMIKKEVLSYVVIISWLINGLNETFEQDENMNLFLTEKDIKKLNSNKKIS